MVKNLWNQTHFYCGHHKAPYPAFKLTENGYVCPDCGAKIPNLAAEQAIEHLSSVITKKMVDFETPELTHYSWMNKKFLTKFEVFHYGNSIKVKVVSLHEK